MKTNFSKTPYTSRNAFAGSPNSADSGGNGDLLQALRNPLTLNNSQTIAVNPTRALLQGFDLRFFIFLALHLPLALLMERYSVLATVHALSVVVVGFIWALSAREVQRVAYVAGYVIGAEVLWRMTSASVPWEIGKYLVAALLGLVLIRFRLLKPNWGLLYLVLLLPSAALTIQAYGLSDLAREQISFNLSGHLALAVCAIFFTSIQLNETQRQNLLWAILIPITGIAAIASYASISTADLNFTLESNSITSGGFGPNQVSAVLGLGALIGLFIAFGNERRERRLLATGISIWLLIQTALTFSRGGLFNVIICAGLVGVHYLPQPRLRKIFMSTLTVALVTSSYFVIPWLNAVTDGKFEDRFTSIDSTHRVELAQVDLEIWLDNPVLGVGPGVAKGYRATLIGLGVAAHTEFTRMLAEHGSLGLLAILVLLLLGFQAYRRAPSLVAKAWVAALIGWSLAEMTHAAMRVAAISFVFGLALVQWPRDSDTVKESPRLGNLRH